MAKPFLTSFHFNKILKMQNMPNKIQTKYQCLLCKYLLNDKQDALDHCSKLHPTKKGLFIFRVVYAVTFNEPTQMKILYQCSICDICIYNKDDLLLHTLEIHPEHTNYECTDFDMVLDNSHVEAKIKNQLNGKRNSSCLFDLDIKDIKRQRICLNNNNNNYKEEINNNFTDWNSNNTLENNEEELYLLYNNDTDQNETNIKHNTIASMQYIQVNKNNIEFQDEEDSNKNLTDIHYNIVVDSNFNMDENNDQSSSKLENIIENITGPEENKNIATTNDENSCLPNKLNFIEQDAENSYELKLKCCFCDYVFNDSNELKNHLNTMHKNLKPGNYPILTHLEVTENEFITKNENTKHQPRNSCNSCLPNKLNFIELDEKTNFNSCLRGERTSEALHSNTTAAIKKVNPPKKPKVLMIDSENLVIKYKCFVCFRLLSTEALLYKHINAKHFKVFDVTRNSLYECVYCLAHYQTKHQTVNHIKIIHANQLKMNEITIRPLILSTNRLLRMRCLICKKICKNIVYYRQHIKMYNHKVQACACDKCPRLFSNQIDLEIHLKKHFGAGKILCKYCGGFYSRNGYKTHKSVHDTRQYICQICDKIFATDELLSSHLGTHENLDYLTCGFCHKLFQTIRNLTRHIKLHSINVSSHYTCVSCGLIFARRILLQNHKIAHTKHS